MIGMSEAVSELATALAIAQSKMPNAAYNRENPHFHSKYADLAAIRDATLPHLTVNGLSMVQTTEVNSIWDQETEKYINGVFLRTRLLHKSGEWIDSIYPIHQGTPQQMGSALTYARRYSWGSICGIASEEEDDANMVESAVRSGNLGKQPPARKSAYRARKDKDWETLQTEMEAIDDPQLLRNWGLENMTAIQALPDSWQTFFREAYEARMTELRDGVGEDGKPAKKSKVKEQLEASLDKEETE